MSEKRNRHHKAILDSKDIEAIKAEQKTLKEDYEQHLNKHKETLNQLHESEKSILSNHRNELKEIMRGGERLALLQGLGVGDYSFRAPVGCGWRRGFIIVQRRSLHRVTDEYSHYQIGLTGPVGACLLQG